MPVLCPDNGNLEPMLEMMKSNCGGAPAAVSADAGYWEPEAIGRHDGNPTQLYVATERKRHGAPRDGCNDDGEAALSDDGRREHMRAKLNRAEGKAIYSRRKATVEPVNGQQKEIRGFRRFSLRGLAKARLEWTLVCLAYNLSRLHRMQMAAN